MNVHNLDYPQPYEELNSQTPADVPDDIIKEENKRYRKRIKQLEERILNAENGYKELYTLKYTNVEEELKELKIIAVERLACSSKEKEKLIQLIKSHDMQITYLKEELKNANNILSFQLPARVNNGAIAYEQVDTWKTRCEKMRKQCEKQQTKVNESLQKIRKMKLVHTALFYQDVNRLKILEHGKIDPNNDYYICEQNGRYGVLKFKLIFFKDDHQLKINYQPLLDSEEDKMLIDKLPIYLKEEIEFEQSETTSFIWKILTIINQKEKQ
ncbi:unnamed protein product [Cunninghamella blakesleeana]